MLLTTATPIPQGSNLDLLATLLGNRRTAARLLNAANGSLQTLLGNPHGGAAALTCAETGHRYQRSPQAKLWAAQELVARALAEELTHADVLTSPAAVRGLLVRRLAGLPHEVFGVLLLDAQHRLIAFVELFRGTLAQTSVYPREVVKTVLQANAAAVIFAHNHPSGVAEPSRADELLTQALKQALGLIDVRTLDHFVVAGNQTVSFAERGLL